MEHDTPPRVAVSDVPDNTQMPDVTDHEILPPDCPPDAATVKGDPVTNEAIFVMKNPDCDAFAIVTVVFEELTTK